MAASEERERALADAVARLEAQLEEVEAELNSYRDKLGEDRQERDHLNRSISDIAEAFGFARYIGIGDLVKAGREYAGYMRDVEAGRDAFRERFKEQSAMAERAEADAAVLREALKLFERSSMGGVKPSQGESWIGWQRGDGLSANERQKKAREALELNAGRALLERAKLVEWLIEESYDLRCIGVPTGGDDADVGWEIVSHHMGKPLQRSEGFGRTPEEAMRDALGQEGDHGPL